MSRQTPYVANRKYYKVGWRVDFMETNQETLTIYLTDPDTIWSVMNPNCDRFSTTLFSKSPGFEWGELVNSGWVISKSKSLENGRPCRL